MSRQRASLNRRISPLFGGVYISEVKVYKNMHVLNENYFLK